jgi:transcriptional regulator with XRE-family HTH domain
MPVGRLSIPYFQETLHVAPSDKPRSLGERIAQHRRQLAVELRRDVTAADLAKMLDVNPATVYRWETDEKVPRDDALAAMASLFNVTQGYLRYGPETATQVRDATPATFERIPTKAEREAAAKKKRA